MSATGHSSAEYQAPAAALLVASGPNQAIEAAIPPLEPGDHLSWPEFERRWNAMPNLKNAELIDGVVYMNAAVSARHGYPHGAIMVWLSAYVVATPGVQMAPEMTLRLDLDNAPQPDALLHLPASLGGRLKTDEQHYLNGAPELVVEVAATTASYDLHSKLQLYRRHGVQEYIVWRVLDEEIDWFQLRDGQYQRLAPDSQGMLRSTVFPGLWLDPAVMLRRDYAGLAATIALGVATAEHAEFASRLRAALEEKGP